MALADINKWFQKFTSKRFQRLGREFFWIGLGQAIATLGSLVGVRLLTGVLPPDAYGELALGMTVATLLNQVALGPLSGAALRFFAPAYEAGELGPFLAALRRLLGKATGVILFVVIIISLALLLLGEMHWLRLGWAAISFALLSGYNSTLNGLQNAARQRTIVAWHQALYSWVRFLIAVGLVLWLGADSVVAMLGYLLATLLVLFSQFWFFRRGTRQADVSLLVGRAKLRGWESQMLAYAWPFATWGIFTWAQMASDRWMLQVFSTTQEVGLYAVLYQLGYYPIKILTGLMMQLISPVFFQRAGDASDPSRIRQVHILNWRLTLVSLFLTSVAVLLAFILHGPVFKWLAAPDYRIVSWLLPGVVLAGGLFATGQFASVYCMSNNKTKYLIAPKIVVSIIGILFNALGVRFGGVSGLVLASVGYSILYCLWIFYLVQHRQDLANRQKRL